MLVTIVPQVQGYAPCSQSSIAMRMAAGTKTGQTEKAKNRYHGRVVQICGAWPAAHQTKALNDLAACQKQGKGGQGQILGYAGSAPPSPMPE